MENCTEECKNVKKNELIKQNHSNSVKFHCYALHTSVLILLSYKGLEDINNVMK